MSKMISMPGFLVIPGMCAPPRSGTGPSATADCLQSPARAAQRESLMDFRRLFPGQEFGPARFRHRCRPPRTMGRAAPDGRECDRRRSAGRAVVPGEPHAAGGRIGAGRRSRGGACGDTATTRHPRRSRIGHHPHRYRLSITDAMWVTPNVSRVLRQPGQFFRGSGPYSLARDRPAASPVLCCRACPAAESATRARARSWDHSSPRSSSSTTGSSTSGRAIGRVSVSTPAAWLGGARLLCSCCVPSNCWNRISEPSCSSWA